MVEFVTLSERVLRTGVLGALVLVTIGRAIFPEFVAIDGLTISMMLLAILVLLAPTLQQAKLPGGAEFKFRTQVDAAEQIGAKVQARVYEGGFPGRAQLFPDFVEVPDWLRDMAEERPGDAVAELRRSLLEGVRGAAGRIARNRETVAPREAPDVLDWLAKSGQMWGEQAALMRVLWDLTTVVPLQGDVGADDAQRMLALSDILNDSFALGYSLNFDPNDAWDELGLICRYEHCIEQMPTPPLTEEQHAEWEQRIRENIESGLYEDAPDVRAQVDAMLESPAITVPDESHVEMDGACPVFGHYCPGGHEEVAACEPAAEWVAALQERRDLT